MLACSTARSPCRFGRAVLSARFARKARCTRAPGAAADFTLMPMQSDADAVMLVRPLNAVAAARSLFANESAERLSRADVQAMTQPLERVLAQINGIVLGKEHPIRMALSCLLAGGHLLIEDIPGVGKTTLAHALAATLGLAFQRIQFTSDLLPADIIGVSVYDRAEGSFKFHPGPIFSQVLLADEVNRATPKTQSALLEAMEERQVTTEGETRPLPDPFFVIATQNPSHQVGTFPLPESQLDRFLMRIELGYPGPEAERALLEGTSRRALLNALQPRISADELAQLRCGVQRVYASSALIDYLQALIRHSRTAPEYVSGLSPRAGLALLHSARAWALMDGRTEVLPEDVQAVTPGVVGHRLHTAGGHGRVQGARVAARLIEAVPIP
jgi:MoxR-like ATPase